MGAREGHALACVTGGGATVGVGFELLARARRCAAVRPSAASAASGVAAESSVLLEVKRVAAVGGRKSARLGIGRDAGCCGRLDAMLSEFRREIFALATPGLATTI